MVKKQSRRCKRKQRKSRRQSQRNQRSRRQRQSQRNQRGGMAPFDADYVALGGDMGAYKMAQVYGQNEANAVAQALAHQKGGSDDLAPFKGGRRRQRQSRGRKSQRNQRRQRSQRGGMTDFNAPYSLGYALPGVNPQFGDEGKVMGGWYNPTQGAQGPSIGR